ncbi:MAG: glycosyltransferase family 4 protein [Elusimicrobiota bacterium]
MRAKVVHIITRLDFGGAQQNTLYTVSHLDGARFEPVLISGAGGYLDGKAGGLSRLDRPVRVQMLPDLVREIAPLRDLLACLQLRRLLSEERPAIVHTHSSKAGVLGRIAAALAGVPVIVHTFHGFGFHEGMNPLLRWAYVLLERLAGSLSTRLVFVSKANMRYGERYGLGDRRRYALIRSGVKLSDFRLLAGERARIRTAIGAGGGGPLVVGVGNLKPQKNAADFLRVARRVVGRVPDASFVFIGDGPLRSAIEAEAAASGLGGRLRLLGWRRDVARILGAADVFLLTSLWEGLPRSLVEAMKTGLPCVCYAVDGVRDVIEDGENGFAAPAGDWETLARRVEELLRSSSLRGTMGAKASESIGPEFDIDEMVRRQERLYDECLARSSGPATPAAAVGP